MGVSQGGKTHTHTHTRAVAYSDEAPPLRSHVLKSEKETEDKNSSIFSINQGVWVRGEIKLRVIKHSKNSPHHPLPSFHTAFLCVRQTRAARLTPHPERNSNSADETMTKRMFADARPRPGSHLPLVESLREKITSNKILPFGWLST